MNEPHDQAMIKSETDANAGGALGKYPRVLVIWESKHGSTTEISHTIAARLRAAGLDVTAADVQEIDVTEQFDAFVIGSAVYAGHWMKHIKQFVRDHQAELKPRPVWLFSSGPIGPKAGDDEPPVDVAEMSECSSGQDHRVFAGKLDRRALGWAERAVVTALSAPYGDFRDWDQITAWADSIAEALTIRAQATVGPAPGDV